MKPHGRTCVAPVMKRVSPPVVTLILLGLLASCERPGPVDKEAQSVAPEVPPAKAPDPLAGGPPPISPDADPSGVIPPALQGRWGLTPADCEPGRSDAKGLLVISPTDIKFYESRAVPTSSIESDSTGISGNFDFSGEGHNWSKYVSLKLTGTTLTRTERSPMASYRYAKCD